MKNLIIGLIVVIIVLCVVILILFVNNVVVKTENSNNYENGTISEYLPYLNKSFPEKGYIPDAVTARKTAEAILYPIYGDSINNKKPFIVKFDEENQVWIVEGQLPKNYVGGVPYVIIQKTDGKILAVWHTK